MKNILFLTLLLTMFFLGTVSAEAANRYVRAGAIGATNGADWNNAYTSLPASLVRGDTYYIADGAYSNYTLDDNESGALVITIKKATVADHGTSSGWSDTYGDGQASFGQFAASKGYYTINGQTRNESDWSQGSAYGFHISNIRISSFDPPFTVPSNMIVQYVDLGGTEGAICRYVPSASCDAGVDANGSFYFGGFGVLISNWTISRFRSHNTLLPFQLHTVDNIIIEYGWIGPSWQKEAIRGGNGPTTNVTIRYNKFVDSCKGLPTDQTGNACTAIIAIWGMTAPGTLDGNKVHGNLFFDTINYPGDPAGGVTHTDGCVFIGGNGGNWSGVTTNNSVIYNNTFVGVRQNTCVIAAGGSGTGNQVYNNIWYAVTAITGCIGTVPTFCNNNSVIGSGSQFINALTNYPATGFDYHLASATTAGTTLSSPYNQDMDGKTRGADGALDRGGYEFGGGGSDTTPPAAPINLRFQ